jgi:hypothetical protein
LVGLTFTAKNHGQIPKLRHVESLKHLTLVRGAISVQSQRHALLVMVVVCKSNASTDRNLGTDDAVATVEAGSKHVHRSSLAVCDSFPSAQKLAND